MTRRNPDSSGTPSGMEPPYPLDSARPLGSLLDVLRSADMVSSQADLAARRGVSQAAVAKAIAAGGGIGVGTLAAYAAAAGWRLVLSAEPSNPRGDD